MKQLTSDDYYTLLEANEILLEEQEKLKNKK
jgi:hypothetical protein